MFKDYLIMFVAVVPAVLITYFATNILSERHDKIISLQNQVWELQKNNCNEEYSNRIMYRVTVTTYNPTRGQTDSTPNITADGTKFHTWKASSYRYVALSRDLLSRWGGPFEYGDYVVIEGTGDRDGIYQVRDTMNPRWTNRVDILTTNSRFKYDNVVMYKYVEEYLVDNN